MSNPTSYAEQSNTQPGHLVLPCDDDLTGKEGRLAVLGGDGLEEVATRADSAIYAVLEGGETEATVLPITTADRNIRLRAVGTGERGAPVVLSALGSGGVDAGKVSAVPVAAGTYFSPGIAEEDFVADQLVRIRPYVRNIVVSGG